jgi:hypothetical protein
VCLRAWGFSFCGAPEEFFSRTRRAEIRHHHHIAGAYLLRYAQEASWREDNRRSSNGEQVNVATGGKADVMRTSLNGRF